MRLLVLSNYAGHVKGWAPFERSVGLVHSLLDQYKNMFVEFILPANDGSEFKYDQTAVEQYVGRDRIRFHHVSMLRSSVNAWAAIPRELYDIFNLSKTTMFYDAVLSGWMYASPLLKSTLKTRFGGATIDPPIFNFTVGVMLPPWVDKKRHAMRKDSGINLSVAEVAAYNVDYMIFQTQIEKKDGLRNARAWLSPSCARDVLKNSAVSRLSGVDCQKIDAVRKKIKKGDKIHLGWGGRWAAEKGFKEILMMFDNVYRSGVDCDITLTTGFPAPTVDIEGLRTMYPHITFITGVDKHEYYKHLVKWDITIQHCPYEVSSTATLEAHYGGVLVLYNDNEFARTFLPEGYPLIGSAKDLPAMLKVTVKNYTKYKKWVPIIRKKIKNECSNEVEAVKFHDYIVPMAAKHLDNQREGGGALAQLVKSALNGQYGPISFDDVCKRMQERSESSREFGRKGDKINRAYIRMLILKAGYKDLCTGPEPLFVKDGEPGTINLGEVAIDCK